MKYAYELHQRMLENNLILIYEGEFTQEITKSVVTMTEQNLVSVGEETGIKRKVFNVMVECLQNIVKHSDTLKKEESQINSAIFMVGVENNAYIIVSGNAMKTEHVEGLKKKLDQVNSLDKEGLKALYKDIIKTTTISEKGGAGLGFVDMARKSGQKLGYNFESINDEFTFFTLKTLIAKKTA